MRDTGTEHEADLIDLTTARAADGEDFDGLRQRMLELEAELEQAKADVGRLQLQVDLFTSTDPVTGFVNRSGTVDAIQSALDRLDRMSEPVTVLAITVPELAAVRDQLDDITLIDTLRHVGALIAGGLRRVDRVGRLENDTFVSVLSNLGPDAVDVVLGRLEAALVAQPVELGDDRITLRPRLGALVLRCAAGTDADLLLEEALSLPALADDDGRLVVTR
ncbi:MAG: GGDEF domain-containing protein [Actinomycetota bacterium]